MKNHLMKNHSMKNEGLNSSETKRASVQLESLERDGTFSGYASLFDKTDLGKDRVMKGAFSRSINRRKVQGIRMLFQHDPTEPIGTWLNIREDECGLFVKGKITEASKKGAEILGLLRDGAIDGLSIGFKTVRSRMDRKSGVREILEADLWEISIVTFPMLPQARVATVKTHSPSDRSAIPTVRTFERWLTQDAGLSRSQARTVIGKGFGYLARKQDAAVPQPSGFAKQIRKATKLFQQ